MIKFYKNINNDPQFKLYELLKLRKSLESKYLRGADSLTNKDFKLLIKCLLLTKSISIFLERDIADLRNKIASYLEKNFATFKEQGEQFVIPSLSSVEVDVPFFKELSEYNARLEDHDAALIVQGSYADGTFINYSDIDLVIIGVLSKEVRDIKKEIDNFLLNLDPLQHHGAFFIHKDSFFNYWQMDLPVETLKKSILLSKRSTLNISVPFYFKEKYSAYYWLSTFIDGHPKMPLDINSGAFFSKYFLSQLMLVPALVLAYKGDFVYKKESFPLSKKLYTDQAWQCMEIASDIRAQWDQGNISHKYSTDRKSAADMYVEEYNTLPDVMNVERLSFAEFDQSYQLFIQETKKLLNELR